MGAQSRKFPGLDTVLLSVQSDTAAGGRGALRPDPLRAADGVAGGRSDAWRCAGVARGPRVRGDARMEVAGRARQRALKYPAPRTPRAPDGVMLATAKWNQHNGTDQMICSARK